MASNSQNLSLYRHPESTRTGLLALLVLLALVGLPSLLSAQTPPEEFEDPEATLFMQRCFQCHTGLLTGRELVNTHQRSEENLRDTVYRMQQYAGMLSEEQVDALVSLMKDQSFVFRIEEAKLELETAPPAPADESGELDEYARLFVQSCATCHTVGGGNIPGGDLSHTSVWPDPRLQEAVSRMQDRVGPLTTEQINGLSALLKDSERLPRLTAAGYISTAPPSATPQITGQASDTNTGTQAAGTTGSENQPATPSAEPAHESPKMPMDLIYGIIIFTIISAIVGYFVILKDEE